MQRKLILIADSDRTVLKELGNAFHGSGYDVRAARDGSRALEKAILVHPDLVLFDAECPLIPPKKYIRILRSNPRTEHIPVIVMGAGDFNASELWGYREAIIHKPFNTDEVLSLVATIFRRMATARQVREGGREIEGSLGQIALVDLLQIFKLNTKTGLLELKADEQEGRIHVHDGGVVHASCGRHKGEKALFRMLQWREGTFAFIPEHVTGDLNIRRSTDMLLIEGARQADELERLREALPGDSVRLAITDPDLKARFEGLHPVTEEILNLLEFYNTVGEIIEHSRVSDFETCRGIQTLLEKGVLKPLAQVLEEPGEEAPLLEHDLLFELKVRLTSARPGTAKVTRGKICLLCPDPAFTKAFLGGLRRLPGVDLRGQVEAVRNDFGPLGQLSLSENLVLDMMLLPTGQSMAPLWGPLGVSVSGILLLWMDCSESGGYQKDLLGSRLERSFEAPVVCLTRDDPGGLTEALRVDPADSMQVRSAMVELLRRIAKRDSTDQAA
ncbi:MAG: DUF4388 domain-containing protein [Deltaproteobacteria bacterium]|nr:DUF4388 domain-containing protein [Deltaproteobacteria bacterium]